MKELLQDMFDEKEDFYKYVKLAKEDEKNRQVFAELAKQEKGYYKMLYDIIFCSETMKDKGEMTKAIQDYAKCEYEKMDEVKW